jgi:hypothetical protein
LRKSKLIFCADGPFKILEKINDNAYKLELPPEFGVSPIFNISDLRPYLGEEDEVLSRKTSNQEGEDDKDITTLDTTTPSRCAGTNFEIMSRTTTSSGKFILLFVR